MVVGELMGRDFRLEADWGRVREGLRKDLMGRSGTQTVPPQ